MNARASFTLIELLMVVIGSIIAGGFSGVIIWDKINKTQLQLNQAIQQCEQSLPRNQHCEPVISARVVEEIDYDKR